MNEHVRAAYGFLLEQREHINAAIAGIELLIGAPAEPPAPRKKEAKRAALPPVKTYDKPVTAVGIGLSGQCGEAIVKFLSKQDLRCADGAVIRREVAKLMGVKHVDSGFKDACRNGLTNLRVRGRVTRKGTMWELTGEVPS